MTEEKTKVVPFDLSEIDTAAACDNIVKFEIVSAKTGEGVGVFLHLKGAHCPDFIKAKNKIDASNTRAFIAYNQLSKNSPLRDLPAVPAVKQLANDIALLSSVTCGLSSMAGDEEVDYWNINRDEILYSKEAVEDIYRRFPDIRAQADIWIGDIAAFMKSKLEN